MSNELVTKDYTPEQMKLITDVVAKGATPDELQLFLYRCRNLGLDPLKSGQIYFVKYGSSPGTIVVGIDGFRSKASRTGKLAGIKRGVTRNDKGAVTGAWAEVFRSDWREPAREEVSLAEYNTGRAMWAKMPETMIKKVAEAAALRMAFPDDLGGTYVTEEMDQAEKPNQILMEQPHEDDGLQIPLPMCELCKGDLKHTSKKSGRYPNGSWYCPNWNDKKGDHTIVTPEDYAAWKQEIVNFTIEQRTKVEAEELK